jgi:hypothetical protein
MPRQRPQSADMVNNILRRQLFALQRDAAAVALGRKGRKAWGQAINGEKRAEAASKATKSRWAKT